MKQIFKLCIIFAASLACLGLIQAQDQPISVANARLAADGDTVTISGIVTRAKGRLAYVQDVSAGIAIFQTSGEFRDSVESEGISRGDSILITGQKTTFNGLEEIVPVSFSVVSDSASFFPVSQTIEISDILANGESFESEIIRIEDLSTSAQGTWDPSFTYTLFGPANSISLRTPAADDTDIDGLPIPERSFTFEGILGVFEINGQTNFQLTPIDATDIILDVLPTDYTLTILHNNDGESQIVSTSGEPDFGGVARFKALVDSLRAAGQGENEGVITLSSGDNFLAGPEFNASLNRAPGLPLYDAIVADSLNYDALAIGNHDFDFGPEILARYISEISVSSPPFVSANLTFSDEPLLQALVDEGRIVPSTIITLEDGEEIGIVGATTPNLPFIATPGDVEVLQNVAELVQAEVNALIADSVNKIILISHLQGIGEDTSLLAGLTGIDIAIAGGGDELLANEGDLLLPGDEIQGPYPLVVPDANGDDVYVVTTSGSYGYVGRLIVEFDEEGTVVSIGTESGPVRVSGVAPDGVAGDPGLQSSVVDSIVAELDDLANNVIGTTEVSLEGRRDSIRFVETNLGNLIADAFLWQSNQLAANFDAPQATVALANGGGIRNDNLIPADTNLTELLTFDILPFPNFMTIVEDISPVQFKEIMENAVSRVDGTDGTGRFAQIAGFNMEYNIFAPARQADENGVVSQRGSRVRTITLSDGTPIVEDGQVSEGAPNVNIATVDFLAGGGDQYPLDTANFTILGASYQQALFNFITQELGGVVTAEDYPEGGEGRIVEGDNTAFFQLTILHNNDGESQLISASGEPDFGGAARFKTVLDSLRAEADVENAGTVTLSSGDNFLPGPEFNASLRRAEGLPFYDAVVIDSLGYDALAIGNHDLDFGPDILADFINDVSVTQPVYLSANLDVSPEPRLDSLVTDGRIAASAIVNKGGMDIGIIGATTPNLPFISSPGDIIVLQDVASIVQAEVDSLITLGVDKIILISHLQGIGEDTALVSNLTGVDVAIAGGGDELLANPDDLLLPGDTAVGPYPRIVPDANGDPVYIVTTAGSYGYVGKLVLFFDEQGNVVGPDPSSGPVRVSGTGEDAVAPDPGLQSNVIDSVSAFVDDLAQNIIGTTEVALDGQRSSIRFVETNLGNMIADAFLWQANQLAAEFGTDSADVAIGNGGGIRNDNIIPADTNITELLTFDILPFPNFITVVEELSPAQFKQLMENAVSRVDGTDGTGRFGQIAGFEVVYTSLNNPIEIDEEGNILKEGNRIISITLEDGTPIVEEGLVVQGAPNVNVATVDFLARGGDQYPFGDASFTLLGTTYQQALFNYIINGLNGIVTSEDYPEGGEGRIIEDDNTALTLTIFHNNDAESQIINSSDSEDFGGAARFVAVLDSLRRIASDDTSSTMTLSSGDNFLAGPEFNASLNRAAGLPIYDAVIVDSIGYDALAIGNHEFDFGPELLARFIGDVSVSQPSFLSANLNFTGEPSLQALVDNGRIASSVIVTVESGDSVGVIGATTPNLASISTPGGVTVNPDVQLLVQAEIDSLLGLGVDKIILISHLQGIGEDTALIRTLSGVDVAIAGGGSELLANSDDLLLPGDSATGPYPLVVQDADGRNVSVVTTSGDYEYVGRLIVRFDQAGNVLGFSPESGPVRVSGVAPDGVAPDDAVQTNVVDSVRISVDSLIANVISRTEVDLNGLRSEIRSRETNLGNLIADAFLWQANQLAADFNSDTATVAIGNGGGIRNDNIIPANSDMTEFQTFEILPFSNFITIVREISPQQFKEIMENAVSRVDTSSGTGRFPQVAGFDIVYDPAAQRQLVDDDGNVLQEGSRVISILLDDGTAIVENGLVVNGAPSVNISTVDFLARGGDQYPFRDAPFTILGVSYQQALFNYLINGIDNRTVTSGDYPVGGEARITIDSVVTAIEDFIENAVELDFQAFPVPANEQLTLSFELPDRAEVTLSVYNMLGAEVATIIKDPMPAGKHSIQWNLKGAKGKEFATGTYILRLQADQFVSAKRISIVNE